MSDLQAGVLTFSDGLDLASPKMLVKPGSMLDCLNYELTDTVGYSRIDGFQRYDGNVSLTDIPAQGLEVIESSYTGTVITQGLYEDENGNTIGYIFSSSPNPNGRVKFVSFTGTKQVYAYQSSVFEWKAEVTDAARTTITQAQLVAVEAALRGQVTSLPETPVGLHWFVDSLFAVVPLQMVPYAASANNQAVAYTLGGILTNSLSGTATLLRKVVTQVAGPSAAEKGYLVVADEFGTWEATAPSTNTLGGAVSVGSGSIYLEQGNLTGADSTACTLWRAARPSTYTSTSTTKPASVTGWLRTGILPTWNLTVTLDTAPAAAPVLNTIRKNNTVGESTYYFADSGGVLKATLLDYFVVSGGFDTGDAVLRLQIADLGVQSGAPAAGIDTSFEMTTDAAGLMDIGDVTVRMDYNYLPGLPQLISNASKYEFKTANFYASDDMVQMYGVSGASRAFAFDGTYLTFIYTQDDDALDKPRHLANHALHLALGFPQGSVQMSVGGQPTNFSGLEGASDIGVGDRVTGLMEVEGTTLAVFCEQSIWSIVGTAVDNFQTQVIVPNSGCIEYTLANFGTPVYLDNYGVSTLQTSARYGDFVGSRMSAPVAPWLKPRCRSSILAINNSAGVALALPIRGKNQYRLFFNDGRILTMTLLEDQEGQRPGFTFQTYYLNQAVITDTNNRLIPICGTSEVDRYGVERTYVAHYNLDSPVVSKHVYALDSGDSFDGNYIPHYFDTNWFFGDTPYVFSTLQGVRAYGTSRGLANVDLHVVGQQEDFGFSGATLSTRASDISLPRVATDIRVEQTPVSTRTEISGRGLSLRLRFIGTNTDLALAEPSHVFQVLLTYSSPEGAYDL